MKFCFPHLATAPKHYPTSSSFQASDLRIRHFPSFPKSVPAVFDLQHPTPAGESLTFVVTLLDQDAWLYSGYRYSSPTMIFIINRVLSSNFPATIVSNIHDVTPPSSSASTPFHALSGPCLGISDHPIPPVETLWNTKTLSQSVKLFHLWIFSRSPC